MCAKSVIEIKVTRWTTVRFSIKPTLRLNQQPCLDLPWKLHDQIPCKPNPPGGLAFSKGFRPLHGLVAWAALFLFASQAMAVNFPPLWRWSNPSPHGANVVDQAANEAWTVQVGERGQIYLSDDWQMWLPRDTYTTAALRGVTFFNGRLVVTGEAGTVLFADNPWDFHGLTLGTSDWLESVAASPGQLVAVGDNAAIYTSSNAVSWKRVGGLAFTKWLRSVAYGGNSFVAVGEDGLIITSSSGTSWQTKPTLTTANLNRVAWMGDHFLVVGDGGTMLTSANGGSWTLVNSGATAQLFGAGGARDSHVADGNLEVRLSEANGPWTS